VEIKHITQNKADFLDLLLLADESETMIALYLDRGEMFALYDDDLKSICVVTQEGKNLYEIKNLATYPPFQRQGYARRLIEYIENRYNAPGTILQVGTTRLSRYPFTSIVGSATPIVFLVSLPTIIRTPSSKEGNSSSI
jgi:GNAT superfamily N-acetyltransferase